jgi:hypothetical protein
MTSQNPVSPDSQNSQLDRDTLAKVNAHADRSMDRLFADIDELLSGDLDNDPASSAVVNRSTTADRSNSNFRQMAVDRILIHRDRKSSLYHQLRKIHNSSKNGYRCGQKSWRGWE